MFVVLNKADFRSHS